MKGKKHSKSLFCGHYFYFLLAVQWEKHLRYITVCILKSETLQSKNKTIIDVLSLFVYQTVQKVLSLWSFKKIVCNRQRFWWFCWLPTPQAHNFLGIFIFAHKNSRTKIYYHKSSYVNPAKVDRISITLHILFSLSFLKFIAIKLVLFSVFSSQTSGARLAEKWYEDATQETVHVAKTEGKEQQNTESCSNSDNR